MREIVEMIESGLGKSGDAPAFQVIGHYYLQNGQITFDGIDAEATRKMRWLMDNTDAYHGPEFQPISAAQRPIAWFRALPMTFSGLNYYAKVVT